MAESPSHLLERARVRTGEGDNKTVILDIISEWSVASPEIRGIIPDL